MKVVSISGTPGSGKSFLANEIKNYFKDLDVKIICLTSFIKKNKLYLEKDSINDTLITDVRVLSRELNKYLFSLKCDLVIVDGHMSHLLSNRQILQVIVRSDLSSIHNRLKKRKYSELKIKDNLESEIFNVCYEESVKKNKKRDNVIFFNGNLNSVEFEVMKKTFSFKKENYVLKNFLVFLRKIIK